MRSAEYSVIIRRFLEDIMYGRKSSWLFGALLFFLSLPYELLVRARLAAYDHQLLKRKKLPCPVISVGNITLGGTGKTPAVIAIAGLLLQWGKKPVILSRGYGRQDGPSVIVVSDGTRTLVNAAASGDEPALMASQMPEVPVIVGKDRYTAGMTAVSRFQPDVAVLDDGFQHIRLHRDLDLLLIDGREPFGTGRLFPAGTLREPVASLRRADAVLITRADQSPDIEALKQRIREITAAPIFTSRHHPTDLVDLSVGSRRPVEFLRGRPVLAFSGIAKPESFIALLEGLGADIRKIVTFPDHHPYSRSDLESLHEQAGIVQASLLVTTEKDGVKIRDLEPSGIQALRIGLEILEKNDWERLLLRRL